MRVRRIFRNTVFSLAGHGVGDLCSLVFLAVLARKYGSDVLGEFWFAMAVGAVLGTVVTHGTRSLILRDMSQRLDMTPKFVGAAAGMQLLIAAGLLFAVLVASQWITDTPRARSVLIIIVLYQIGYVLTEVFRVSFNAHEEMHFNAILESGHKILILVAGVGAIFLAGSPAIVLTIYPIAALATYIAGYAIVTRRYGRPLISMDWKLNWYWTVAAFPLFGQVVLQVLANRSGIIILHGATDAATVGQFAAADRLVSAFGLPFVMLTGAVFPIMAKLTQRTGELRRFVRTCLRVSAAAAVPVSAFVIMFREPILALAFGEEFIASSTMLGVLALGIALTALNSLLSVLLVATDNLWVLLKLYAASLLVLFIGILVSVETSGGVGLAWSVVASKAALLIGLLAYLQRGALEVSGFRSVLAALFSAIAMLLIFQSTPMLGKSATVVVTMLSGLIVLVVFRGIEPDDVRRLRQAVGV